MPLSPDDVVTKQFQHVRFKEGFDPDEVDDFLDEIVVEWRAALAENEVLKARIAELEADGGGSAAPASADVVVEEAPAPTPAPVAAPVVTDTAPSTQSAGIIELAQRLHDEHVAEGRAQRDQLISDAQSQATKIVADAEAKGRDEIERLERERGQLEARINDLRQFERDYRQQLRGYIEGKLRDLDSTASASGQAPVSAIGL